MPGVNHCPWPFIGTRCGLASSGQPGFVSYIPTHRWNGFANPLCICWTFTPSDRKGARHVTVPTLLARHRRSFLIAGAATLGAIACGPTEPETQPPTSQATAAPQPTAMPVHTGGIFKVGTLATPLGIDPQSRPTPRPTSSRRMCTTSCLPESATAERAATGHYLVVQ